MDTDEIIEQHYKSLKGIFVQELRNKPNTAGLVLDLNALPTNPINLKEAVIKWLVKVNLPRILSSQEPIISLELVLKCPVWKLTSPPFRRLTLKKERMLNKPKAPKIINKQRTPGAINR